jgi:hypothetical protein
MIAPKEQIISAAGTHAGYGCAREIGLLIILTCP